MSLLSRAFSTRYFTPASFQRIASIKFPRAYSTGSSDGGDKPSKSGISGLLSSLKKKDKKGDLKEILQRGKQVKEPQKETLEAGRGAEEILKSVAVEESVKSSKESLSHSSFPSKDDVRAGTSEGSVETKREASVPPSQTTNTSEVSDTMKKMFKKDAANLTLTPEIHGKLKSILSKLKVDSAQSNLSKDIVGAAKSWGRVSPRYRKDIVNDFKMQSKREAPRVTREISLTDGGRFDLFDDIFQHRVPSAEPPPHKLGLLEGIEMEMLLKYEALDQRNDFMSLIEIADKQWKFPVDNEVCKVEEEGVSFEEHVFLGYLLDEFPKTGPVRRFMELVINGLEQNPHMTVEQKNGQAQWFKEYFDNVPEEDLSF